VKAVIVFLGLCWVLRRGFEYGRAFELMNGMWQPNDVWARFIASSLAEHRR
jgi:hypothetical protein